MKKIFLILPAIFVATFSHAQANKGIESIVKTGKVAAESLGPLTLKKIVEPVATVASLPASTAVKKITSSQVLRQPYLEASTGFCTALSKCGQSSIGFPQYIYARNAYNSINLLEPDEMNDSLRRLVAAQMAAKIEETFPGTINADLIAEEALDPMEEYIPSYNANWAALAEDKVQLKATVAYLEHLVELAYKSVPEVFFEGTFVRTFEEITDIFHNGSISFIGPRNVRRAMEQAHAKGLEKDAGFFILKVGDLNMRKVEDVLVLNLPNMSWVSYQKNMNVLKEMAEEAETAE